MAIDTCQLYTNTYAIRQDDKELQPKDLESKFAIEVFDWLVSVGYVVEAPGIVNGHKIENSEKKSTEYTLFVNKEDQMVRLNIVTSPNIINPETQEQAYAANLETKVYGASSSIGTSNLTEDNYELTKKKVFDICEAVLSKS